MKTPDEKNATDKSGTGTPARAGEVGRPELYSPELAAEFCARLAEGKMMREICEEEGMPSKSTVFRWLYKDEDGFRDAYAIAREYQTEAIAEELFEISDDGRNDWMERHYGDNTVWVENGEATRRSQLRLDTRKWWLSKIKAKKYGDKLDVTSGGETLPTPIYGGLSSNGKKRKVQD